MMPVKALTDKEDIEKQIKVPEIRLHHVLFLIYDYFLIDSSKIPKITILLKGQKYILNFD
jgi:hypothetical protein